MADYTGERKHFRFPAFTDAEGVKLNRAAPRQIFSEDEPTFISKSPLRNEQDYGLRHLDEVDAANQAAQKRDVKLTPTKEKDWQPGKTMGQETKNINFTVSKVPYTKAKTPHFDFESPHKALVTKRPKEKSWLPEELEVRINKHTALEQKLANTRFAEDRNKFTPRYVPEQMYGVDPLIEEAQTKNNLAKQLCEEKKDFLMLATAEEESLPELNQVAVTSEPVVSTSKTDSQVTSAEEVVKRSVPHVVERDFLAQPKASLKAIKADLEVPAIKKRKAEDLPNKTRLEKSLSGIMSEQGPMTNNSYFKE